VRTSGRTHKSEKNGFVNSAALVPIVSSEAPDELSC
jgi:hypothetical protein